MARPKGVGNSTSQVDSELLKKLFARGLGFGAVRAEHERLTGHRPNRAAVNAARKAVLAEVAESLKIEREYLVAETLLRFEANMLRAMEAWERSLEPSIETIQSESGTITKTSQGRPNVAAITEFRKNIEAIALYNGLKAQVEQGNAEAARATLERQGYTVIEPAGDSLERIEIIDATLQEGDRSLAQ